MRSASTEFNNIIYGDGNKQYVGKADITLADDTVLHIVNADLWQNGIQVTEASSNSGSFDIGFCACNQLTLLVNNAKGKYSGYDFYDAVVRPQTGLILSGGTEYIKHGVYTVDTPEAMGMYISLLCMDNMHKLDKQISSLSGSTAGAMVNDICIKCGVGLKSVNFDGYNKELTIPGNIADYTYRQALAFICKATGNNARFDQDGLLEIYWYDTSVFEQSNLDGGTFDESEYYAKDGENSQVVTADSPSPEYPSPIAANLPAGTYKYTSGDDIYEFTIADDLKGIGEVKDKIVFDKVTHRGYVDRYCGKKVFDGTLTYNSDPPTARSTSNYVYVATNKVIPAMKPKTEVVSDKLKYRLNGMNRNGENNISTSTVICFNLMNTLTGVVEGESKASYVDKIKAYIATNPITVVYQLNEPTRTELIFTKVSSSSAPEIDASLATDLSTLPYVYPYTSGDTADGGNFTDYSSGDNYDGGSFIDFSKYHHIYSFTTKPTIGTDDIVITGIKVINSDTGASALYGSEEYALVIEDNPFITGMESDIAAFVGAKIVGMRFRQFSATARSNPLIQAGDPAYVTYKGDTYQCYITRYVFKISQTMEVSCDAESPQANSSAGLSEKTRVIMTARRVAKQEITSYDLTIQQLTNLIAYGYGMYKTEEKQSDGSTKYYMHNKPTIAESSVVWTINSGGLAVSTDHGVTWGVDTNGNMLVNVLTAIGINAEWIKTGEISGIKITMEEGNIGPFTLNESGLTSKYMEFYDDGNYPLIWISKPGTDGGTFDSRADGSARANYEPSVMVVRSIENGIETDVTVMARTNPSTGEAGTITIAKIDLATNQYISRQVIDSNRYRYEIYENGDEVKATEFNPFSHLFLIDYTNNKTVQMFFNLEDETMSLQAQGGVFINGRKM